MDAREVGVAGVEQDVAFPSLQDDAGHEEDGGALLVEPEVSKGAAGPEVLGILVGEG